MQRMRELLDSQPAPGLGLTLSADDESAGNRTLGDRAYLGTAAIKDLLDNSTFAWSNIALIPAEEDPKMFRISNIFVTFNDNGKDKTWKMAFSRSLFQKIIKQEIQAGEVRKALIELVTSIKKREELRQEGKPVPTDEVDNAVENVFLEMYSYFLTTSVPEFGITRQNPEGNASNGYFEVALLSKRAEKGRKLSLKEKLAARSAPANTTEDTPY